jgi:hypothetical protein
LTINAAQQPTVKRRFFILMKRDCEEHDGSGIEEVSCRGEGRLEVLSFPSDPSEKALDKLLWAVFQQTMSELGYTEGRNIIRARTKLTPRSRLRAWLESGRGYLQSHSITSSASASSDGGTVRPTCWLFSG